MTIYNSIDTKSPLFRSGSFLVFCGDETLEGWFSDHELKKESAAMALASLLAILDTNWPGQSFICAKTKTYRKMAKKWLKQGSAGLTYWGDHQRHICLTEENERDVLEWPYDKITLTQGITLLLLQLKPMARAFYQLRAMYMADFRVDNSRKRKRNDDNDEGGKKARVERQVKKPKATMAVRRK